jgi:type IV secretion system protein TrbI
MTDASTPPPEPQRQSPEELSLRARPIPITRISRRAVIGAAGIMLLLIAGLIVMALRPPTWRAPSPTELVNVDRKPITDGLSKLPSTYDGVRAERPDRPKAGEFQPGVPQLETPTGTDNDPERAEKARIGCGGG